MTFLVRVEAVFDICGRGCAITPVVPDGINIRPKDGIQLRTPTGRVFDTHIAAVEFVKPTGGGSCHFAIMLPREFVKTDIPVGTEIWLAENVNE